MRAIFDLKTDINDVLSEFGLPEFKLHPNVKSIEDMVAKIISGYQKEVHIQSIWGGIRNPAGVIQNKIRHELTNYDEVRDALTLALREGMDSRLVIDIREELVDMSYYMVSAIIDLLPNIIEVRDPDKGLVKVSEKQLRQANTKYWERESKQVVVEKKHILC